MTKEDFLNSISVRGEKWKEYPVKDCGYFVSSLGRIVSTRKNRFCVLKQVEYVEMNKSYYSVCLFINGKQSKMRVHRIIAMAFLGNPPHNYYEVDHINGDGLDNKVENLRWCSHSDNMKNIITRERLKRPVARISDTEGIKIYSGIIDTLADGFTPTNVCAVCNGKQKTHRGYRWAYLEDI